jgi:hypothetical protein
MSMMLKKLLLIPENRRKKCDWVVHRHPLRFPDSDSRGGLFWGPF